MGMIGDILGIGKAVKEVAEVFVPNKTETARYEHLEHEASLDQFGKEFATSDAGPFNRFVNGLNRLPRPILALGTVGLFIFAMVDPDAFSVRMLGLDTVPRELWWLLGAIVSFYFGARELHYQRDRKTPARAAMPALNMTKRPDLDNAAVADWLKSQE